MKRRLENTDVSANKRQRLELKSKWSQCSDELIQFFQAREVAEADKKSLVPRTVIVDIGVELDAFPAVTMRINRLVASFEIGFDPSYQQRQLFSYAIRVAMPFIVGDMYEMYKPTILDVFQSDSPLEDLHYVTPRQFGKTTVVARIAKTFVKHLEIKMAVFSTCRETSQNLMTIARRAIRDDPEMTKDRIITSNSSRFEFRIIPLDPNDTRPGRQSLLRAFSANGTSKPSSSFLV